MPALQVLPPSDVPYLTTWSEVEKHFGSTPWRRARILAARSRLELLASAGVPVVTVWLDGSFVTSKEEPRDLDVVVAVDGPLATRNLGPQQTNDLLEAAGRFEASGTEEDHLTDFHYVWWYPPDHVFGPAAEGELSEWFRLWSRVEVGADLHTGARQFVESAKGFLEVGW